MTLFVDTSAPYALMGREDLNHEGAKRFWTKLSPDEPLLTHNDVLVATSALVQRRFGIEALQALVDELMLPISRCCLAGPVHDAAVGAVLI